MNYLWLLTARVILRQMRDLSIAHLPQNYSCRLKPQVIRGKSALIIGS